MRLNRQSFACLLAAGYLLLMVAIVLGLVQGRRWAQSTLSSAKAQDDWQRFRNDVETQVESDSPVRRRVPKSTEPPGLVLMRDHFATCTTISLVLSTMLYAALAFLAYGAFASPSDASASATED